MFVSFEGFISASFQGFYLLSLKDLDCLVPFSIVAFVRGGVYQTRQKNMLAYRQAELPYLTLFYHKILPKKGYSSASSPPFPRFGHNPRRTYNRIVQDEQATVHILYQQFSQKFNIAQSVDCNMMFPPKEIFH